MHILTYLSKNYKLKSISDIIYNGRGCNWGTDMNGKRFDKISENSLYFNGCGCNWFSFDGISFDAINLNNKRDIEKYRQEIKYSNEETFVPDKGDELLDFLTDPSEPLNPLNPFSPISIFNEDSDNE